MSTSISSMAYVWVWLPGSNEPVPAGLLQARGTDLWFRYGERYFERQGAVSLYSPELPLRAEWFGPKADLHMPGALRDGSPDAWGRRVILNRLTGRRGDDVDVDVDSLSELTYLLESGSNRFGAIDFQASATEYVPRTDTASLDDLHRAAELVEAGEPIPPALADALMSGTAIGGARPKALVEDDGHQYIAKFSTTADMFSVVGAEAASIELARRAGINVPPAKVVPSLGRNVLLTERFDRVGGGGRRMVVSGLTILGLGEMTSRYGTYPGLLDELRLHSAHPETVGERLFQRIAFNIAISNTDDHLRNHAAFWDGEHLELTPAYDLSPMNRSGETAAQILAFGRDGERESSFAALVGVSYVYGIPERKARAIVNDMVDVIHTNWDEAADIARLTANDRNFLWGRQILNPAASYGFAAQVVAVASPLGQAAVLRGAGQGACGVWMPRARTTCVLLPGHGGHHRSTFPASSQVK